MISFFLEPDKIYQGQTETLNLCARNDAPGHCSDLRFEVLLPPTLLPLLGDGARHIIAFRAGEIARHRLMVQAVATGAQLITIAYISYRDWQGGYREFEDQKLVLSVLAVAAPQLHVMLLSTALTTAQRGKLPVRVHNEGRGVASRITLELKVTAGDTVPLHITVLRPGETHFANISARVDETGNFIPATLSTTYMDEAGQRHQQQWEEHLVVQPGIVLSSVGGSFTGLPGQLLAQLKQTLLHCAPVRSDDQLQALFVDDRLALWSDEIPEAGNDGERTEALICFLSKRRNETYGENGLTLFLKAVADRVSSADACYRQLTELADAVAETLTIE